MAFKRKLPTEPVLLENFKGGAGSLQKFEVLTPEEMYNKGRVCSVMMLEPGSEIGRHRHEGDCEVFLILSGTGKYLLNGELTDAEPGDIFYADDGDEHYMVNDGGIPLVIMAIVLFTK